MIKEKICLLKNNWCMIAVIVFAGMLLSGQAYASYADYGFVRVTNNNVENVAGQFNVRVWDATQATAEFSAVSLTGNQVLFTFTNNVGIASSISEIYFDDGTIISQSEIYNSLGGFTDFAGPGADPDNLPGGNTVDPPFVATQIFSADAVGNPSKGVDTSTDILGIAYNTDEGLGGIQTALADGSLRIGLHVRAIGTAGGSDSFVNNGGGGPGPGPTPIPEPATMLLLGTGLVGIAGSARRRKKNQA